MAKADHSSQVKVASGINVLLGIWLIISPWVYGFADAGAGIVWNYVIVGALVLIFGAVRFSTPHMVTGFSWANIVLGAWTVLSPWIYGHTSNVGLLWNSVIVGLVVIALAIWSGSATTTERHYQQHA